MILHELQHNGAMPALERMVQFTEARQRVLAHNVANLSTPYFRPRDVDVAGFQQNLGKAIQKRRDDHAPVQKQLELKNTRQVTYTPQGLQLETKPIDENVMFHDRNNRDLERIMQDVAENVMAHQFGINLLKNQFDQLRIAIRERL